jgi:ferredoxin
MRRRPAILRRDDGPRGEPADKKGADVASSLVVEVRGLGGVRRLEAADGEALLEAFLRQGLPAPHRCRRAQCGRCRVFVAAGADTLEPAGAAERARLGPMIASGMRLMCQARARAASERAGGRLVVEY